MCFPPSRTLFTLKKSIGVGNSAKIRKLAHIRMDFAGIMQTVGNKGRYAGLLYIHPLRGFDLFSRS